ncbi:MAG TPA: tripartite tricarboxylate transporter substrate-binding protein [Alphaproteobacteria bacterium]|nr:tripartite tricarboxylate transporter substrate-binding protein [Alphaproteobacteria bacterium]
MKYAVVIAALALAVATSAQAQSGAGDAFKGKEVRIVVGYATGGGYDNYARIVGPFLGKHIPGNPTVVVQNMPGGDGLAVANYMAQRAPRDGTAIALTNRNLAVAPLLGMIEPANVQYDPKQFVWLANLNSEVSVLIVRSDVGVKTLDDVRSHQVVVGATGLTANNAVYPYVANNVLGTKFKVVSGYPGTSHLLLALERKEVDGIGGLAWSSLKVQRPDWIDKRTIVPVLQLGLSKVPELTNVPLILDLAASDRDRRALELVFAPEELGRPFFAAPQTPNATARALRAAFAAAVADEGFKAAAEKAQLEVSFMDGAKLDGIVQRLNGASPDVVDLAKRVMQRGRTEVEER